MAVEVVAELGSGTFAIQEGELEWCCDVCLDQVEDSGAGFYLCECGPSFVVGIVGPFNLNGQPFLLVHPEVPCFEPEPEA